MPCQTGVIQFGIFIGIFMSTLSFHFSLIVKSIQQFVANDGPLYAAAMSYYTAFALPSVLIMSIALAGWFVEPHQARGVIGQQIEQVAGEDAAEQIEAIVIAAERDQKGWIASLVGGVMLLVGSTGVLAQLQYAFNHIWGVKTRKRDNLWLKLIIKRLLSLGMLLVLAFILLVTMTVNAMLAGFGSRLETLLPSGLSVGVLGLLNGTFSFAILVLLLAAMFRVFPDSKIPWQAVWFGSAVTAVLFTLGKHLMAFYIQSSNVGAVYGTAGSLAVILIWVYYACIILLFGAQMTRCWMDDHGWEVRPEPHAVPE